MILFAASTAINTACRSQRMGEKKRNTRKKQWVNTRREKCVEKMCGNLEVVKRCSGEAPVSLTGRAFFVCFFFELISNHWQITTTTTTTTTFFGIRILRRVLLASIHTADGLLLITAWCIALIKEAETGLGCWWKSEEDEGKIVSLAHHYQVNGLTWCLVASVWSLFER